MTVYRVLQMCPGLISTNSQSNQGTTLLSLGGRINNFTHSKLFVHPGHYLCLESL